MKAELLKELIEETEMNDIAERYQNVAAIIGIEKFVQLADYAVGTKFIFRRRRILSPLPGTGGLRRNITATIQRSWRKNTI